MGGSKYSGPVFGVLRSNNYTLRESSLVCALVHGANIWAIV